jgi:hypothetical protein
MRHPPYFLWEDRAEEQQRRRWIPPVRKEEKGKNKERRENGLARCARSLAGRIGEAGRGRKRLIRG